MSMERQDALAGLPTLADEEIMGRVMRQIAENDPMMAPMIRDMGHTPEQYLDILDTYMSRMGHADDPGMAVRQMIDRDPLVKSSPELQAVTDRIVEVNDKFFRESAELFYGNPNRSMFERVASNPLLWWPLSYQLRAAKWLLRTLLHNFGGLPTHAAPGYTYSQLVGMHEQRMATDPEYARWIADNRWVLMASEMIFPMTPQNMGTSLAPVLRDLFFGGTKNILEVGPVYTFTKVLPGVIGNLYQYTRDVPGLGEANLVAGRMLGQTIKQKVVPKMPLPSELR
jgi:hypothetical protein